jgi:hypothetical protein
MLLKYKIKENRIALSSWYYVTLCKTYVLLDRYINVSMGLVDIHTTRLYILCCTDLNDKKLQATTKLKCDLGVGECGRKFLIFCSKSWAFTLMMENTSLFVWYVRDGKLALWTKCNLMAQKPGPCQRAKWLHRNSVNPLKLIVYLRFCLTQNTIRFHRKEKTFNGW